MLRFLHMSMGEMGIHSMLHEDTARAKAKLKQSGADLALNLLNERLEHMNIKSAQGLRDAPEEVRREVSYVTLRTQRIYRSIMREDGVADSLKKMLDALTPTQIDVMRHVMTFRGHAHLDEWFEPVLALIRPDVAQRAVPIPRSRLRKAARNYSGRH